MPNKTACDYTAKFLTVFITAFGSVTCATLIWLYALQPKIAIDLTLYSSMSVNVMCTVVVCEITAKLQWHSNTANDCKLAVNSCSVRSVSSSS